MQSSSSTVRIYGDLIDLLGSVSYLPLIYMGRMKKNGIGLFRFAV